MFMRENRKKNGAPQPETTASTESAKQRSGRMIAPNDYPSQSPEDWRFSAQLGTVAAINDAHYQGGISGDGPYKDAYGASIPFVGVEPSKSKGQEID